MTVSMLRGEEGFQAQGVRKLLAYLKQRAALRRGDAADVAARRPGPAAAARAAAPDRVHAQGEDLFLEGLLEPYRTAGEGARSRRPAPAVDVSSRRATTTPTSWPATWSCRASRSRVAPLGITLRRARAPDRPGRRPALHRRLPRPGRSREGPAPAGRGLHPTAPRARARGRAARGRGLPGARAPRLSRGVTKALAAVGPRGRVPLPRDDRPRAQGRVPARARRALGAEPLRRAKGLYLLEAMASGVPVVQPRHGAFPEIVEATGGGVLFAPGDVADLAAKHLRSSPAIRQRAERAGPPRQRRRARGTIGARAWPSARSRSAPRRRRRSRGRC